VLVPAIAVILVGGAGASEPSATRVSVYASGLVNPKGMAFLDGTLYVAESGKPGNVDVPLPVNFGGKGPIGRNGRVSRIDGEGRRSDFVTRLPNIGLYGGVEMLGAASVTVLGDRLWEVAAGHMTVSPALSVVAGDGTMTRIADLGEFNDDHPPPPSNGDAVPGGNPYDLVTHAGNLYVSDGNYNRVLAVTPAGKITLLAQWERSPVSVGLAAGPDGNLYVAQFSPAPYTAGTGRIDRVTPAGKVQEGVVRGLTTPIDVAFAPDGTMYVLQYASRYSAKRLRYLPFGGKVLRVRPDGSHQTLVTNLIFPTAMAFGPDGALYVTNFGNESNDGQGQILRVELGQTAVRASDVAAPTETGSYVTPRQAPRSGSGSGKPPKKVTIIEPANAQKWGYSPRELRVAVGDDVAFTNAGRIPHTATASNGAFDTGLVRHNETSVVAMTKPGTFAYYCVPHPWMKATIVVTGAAAGGEKRASGGGPPESPPSLSPWTVLLVIGAIVAAVFGLAWVARKQPAEKPPSTGTTGGE
jgi:plastocyanin